jgi:hypothetical protein
MRSAMLATLRWVPSASPERHAHSESVWSRWQADLASVIAKEVIEGGSSQYVCLDPERTRCPRVATHLGTELLNVTVPTEARWLFEGPSYMKEIYETLRTANGGCDPSANPVPAKTALTPPREEWEKSSGKACRLRNGAVLAYLDGESERDSIREETWTHGFFMQPHNYEYYVEKERAAEEKRKPDSDAFADHMGKDMCLPRLDVPGATTFSEYVDCMQAKALDSVGIAQFANKLSDDALLTIVAPWQAPVPEDRQLEVGDGTWHHLAPSVKHTTPYFTRRRASSIDCRADLVEKPVQDLSSRGLDYDMSNAEENLADRKDPGFLDHQCIAVCADHEATHCFPGSVVWMAHDLAHLVSHYRSGDGSRVALGPKVVG